MRNILQIFCRLYKVREAYSCKRGRRERTAAAHPVFLCWKGELAPRRSTWEPPGVTGGNAQVASKGHSAAESATYDIFKTNLWILCHIYCSPQNIPITGNSLLGYIWRCNYWCDICFSSDTFHHAQKRRLSYNTLKIRYSSDKTWWIIMDKAQMKAAQMEMLFRWKYRFKILQLSLQKNSMEGHDR